MAFRVPYARTLAETESLSMLRVARDFDDVQRYLKVRVPFPSLPYPHDPETARLVDRNFAEAEQQLGVRVPYPAVWHPNRRIFHMRIDRNFEALKRLGLFLYHGVHAGTVVINAGMGFPNHGQHTGTAVLLPGRGLPNHGRHPGTAIIAGGGGIKLDWDFEDGTVGPLDAQSAGTWAVVDDGTGNLVLTKSAGGNAWQTRYTSEIFGPFATGQIWDIRGRVRAAGSGTRLVGLNFGGTGSGFGGYNVGIDLRNGSGTSASFGSRVGTGSTLGTDPSPTVVAGDWYDIRVIWDPDVGGEAYLYDVATGDHIGQLSFADNQFAASGSAVGFFAYGDGHQMDNIYMEVRELNLVDDAPTAPPGFTLRESADFASSLGPLTGTQAGTWGVRPDPVMVLQPDGTPIRTNVAEKTAGTTNSFQYIYVPTNYGTVGKTLRVETDVRTTGSGTRLAGIHLAGTGTGTAGYQIVIDPRSGTSNTNSAIQIRQNGSALAWSSAATLATGRWYRLVVEWDPGVGITVHLVNPLSGATLDTLNVATSTYSTGYVGLTSYHNGHQFDRFLIAEEP